MVKAGRPSGVFVVELVKHHENGETFYTVISTMPKDSRRLRNVKPMWNEDRAPSSSVPGTDTALLRTPQLAGEERPPNVSSHNGKPSAQLNAGISIDPVSHVQDGRSLSFNPNIASDIGKVNGRENMASNSVHSNISTPPPPGGIQVPDAVSRRQIADKV